MNEWDKKIFDMAINHVIEEIEGVDIKDGATCWEIESEPNKDGGITHNVSFSINDNLYEVEVYEKDNILIEADCWRINGKMGGLELECH